MTEKRVKRVKRVTVFTKVKPGYLEAITNYTYLHYKSTQKKHLVLEEALKEFFDKRGVEIPGEE